MREDVLEALTENGGKATLTRTVGSALDRVTGKVVQGNPVTINTVAVISAVKLAANNGLIVTQTVATMIEKPLIDDVLTIGASSYTVREVTSIDPDGSGAIVYQAVLS